MTWGRMASCAAVGPHRRGCELGSSTTDQWTRIQPPHSRPLARHRAGSRVPAVRSQPRARTQPGGLRPELFGRPGGRSGRRPGRRGRLRQSPARRSAAARLDPGNGGRWNWRPLGDATFAIRASVAETGEFALVSPDVATCDDCFRDFTDARQPPLRLRVHQLHQLRPALHHHPRYSLRPPQHHHGRLPHVRGLPGGVRRSARPALSCPAQRLPRVRAGAFGGHRRGAAAAGRGRDPGHQGSGRIPPGLRCPQRRGRRAVCASASGAATSHSH